VEIEPNAANPSAAMPEPNARIPVNNLPPILMPIVEKLFEDVRVLPANGRLSHRHPGYITSNLSS
jgi:hypothetical protein